MPADRHRAAPTSLINSDADQERENSITICQQKRGNLRKQPTIFSLDDMFRK